MDKAIQTKWRPTLGMIVIGVLVSILLLPLASISFFRLFENQLVRQTENELIAQSAALAATMAARLKDENPNDLPMGAQLQTASIEQSQSDSGGQQQQKWHPVSAKIDLSKAQILPPRPDPLAAGSQTHKAYLAAGKFVLPILFETQKATLAGFRVLDFNGTVIAGRSDMGMSFAHLPEIESALNGRYSSVLRKRILNNPQPIYSISRGTDVRVFIAMPVIIDNHVTGVIYASRTPSNILKVLYKQKNRLAFAAIFILAVTLIIGFVFSRIIAGPIRELTGRTKRIGEGDRSAIKPLNRHGSRELLDLSEGFLQMSEKLYERNDYINNFATHVSHELKSPLTSIRGAVELLLDNHSSMSKDEQEKFLTNVLEDVDRSTLLLDRLRVLAKAGTIQKKGITKLPEILGAFNQENPDIEFTITAADNLTLAISEENSRIVFDNLIDNSRNHGANRVSVACSLKTGVARIIIKDNGRGISAGNADKIFELFFTTRRQSGGTGMGLGIVRSILEAHKGTIEMMPAENGATFEINIPEAK